MDKNVEQIANSIEDIKDFLKAEVEKDEADSLIKSKKEDAEILKTNDSETEDENEEDENEEETDDKMEKSIDDVIDVEPILKSVAEGYDNQTSRIEVLTKAVQGLINVIQIESDEKNNIIKSMNEKIETLEKSEIPMSGVYNSKDLARGNSIKVKGSNNEVPLTKSLVLKTLLKGMLDGKIDPEEITKYEMSNTPMIKSLNKKTQNYIQSQIDTEVNNG